MKFKITPETRVAQVKAMTPEERFWYWCKERYKLGLLKEAGNPPPWTPDPVLQSYFFTWPYREKDKVTVWFRENIREPLEDNPDVLMATVIFRWFNKIETGQVLIDNGLLQNWNSKRATRILEEYKEKNKCAVFTGAYMIKAGNGPPGCKIGNVCRAIDNVQKCEKELLDVCTDYQSLRALWKSLIKFQHLGPFMSYEIVCDLRYTYLLEDATDIDLWANPGPGAIRGLARLQGDKPNRKTIAGGLKADPLQEMRRLLKASYDKLDGMPQFEMREIEHSLCEYDKYERMLWGDGKSKRGYNGTGR